MVELRRSPCIGNECAVTKITIFTGKKWMWLMLTGKKIEENKKSLILEKEVQKFDFSQNGREKDEGQLYW